MIQYTQIFLKIKTNMQNDGQNFDNDILWTQNIANSTRFEQIKSIRIGNEPTFEEKVDYIYYALKAQKRNARIKFSLKIFVVIALYYFAVMIYPTIPQEKKDAVKATVTKYLSDEIGAIAKPIVQQITDDMIKNATKNAWNTIDTSNINISKMQDFLLKHPELKWKLK